MNRLALALMFILPAVAFADDAPPATQPANRFALTIYSTADPATFDPKEIAQQELSNPYAIPNRLPGYGIVRETRPIDLQDGENTVRFSDVASGIDPTTVSFQSLTAPNSTSALEQNYEYDVVNAAKLLQKYLGKSVSLVCKDHAFQGVLLSADASSLVLQEKDGNTFVLSRQDVDQITLEKQETGLITKPTLVWKIQTNQAGKHNAQVTYQTDGLTWRADYNVLLNADESAADIGAWVSILNQSGASYPDAKLKLVAGDVQRIQPPQPMAYGGAVRMSDSEAAPAGFQEKAFFEYHLYTLGRSTSLADHSTKQIELFPSRANVPVQKIYVYYGLPAQFRGYYSGQPNSDRNLGTQSNKKVDIYLRIDNSEKNGLGIPLPAGRIRVYKKDPADAANEFIGEDVIQHTPKNEKLLIKLGSAFDIVGERKQTNFTANIDGHIITESFEIKLRNHKKAPVDVIVKENLFRWSSWKITKSSDPAEKQDSRTIHFNVQVPPDGEKTVTYTVKYTW